MVPLKPSEERASRRLEEFKVSSNMRVLPLHDQIGCNSGGNSLTGIDSGAKEKHGSVNNEHIGVL